MWGIHHHPPLKHGHAGRRMRSPSWPNSSSVPPSSATRLRKPHTWRLTRNRWFHSWVLWRFFSPVPLVMIIVIMLRLALFGEIAVLKILESPVPDSNRICCFGVQRIQSHPTPAGLTNSWADSQEICKRTRSPQVAGLQGACDCSVNGDGKLIVMWQSQLGLGMVSFEIPLTVGKVGDDLELTGLTKWLHLALRSGSKLIEFPHVYARSNSIKIYKVYGYGSNM